MKKILFLFAILILALSAVKLSQDSFSLDKLLFWNAKKTAKLQGQTFLLAVAKTDKERAVGLSQKTKLAKNEGMVFLFDSPDYYSFWMKDMRLPIDIIFLRDKKIVTIFSRVSPPSDTNKELPIYRPEEPADMVIEISAGLSETLNLKKGDEVITSL